jgi:hypothetical protein
LVRRRKMNKALQLIVIIGLILVAFVPNISAMGRHNLTPSKFITATGTIPADFEIEFEVDFTAVGDSRECLKKVYGVINDNTHYEPKEKILNFKGDAISYTDGRYNVSLPVELEPSSPCLYSLSMVTMFFKHKLTQIGATIFVHIKEDQSLSSNPDWWMKYYEIGSDTRFGIKVDPSWFHFIGQNGESLGNQPAFIISEQSFSQGRIVLDFYMEQN